MAADVVALQQGQYAEAETQFAAGLKEAEGFGPQDPRLATSLNNLAELYRAQGRNAEAEPLHKRSLAIREKALGPNHPNVANQPGELRRPTTADRAQRRGGQNGGPRRGNPRQARQAKPGKIGCRLQRAHASTGSA